MFDLGADDDQAILLWNTYSLTVRYYAAPRSYTTGTVSQSFDHTTLQKV